jgi:hypothetical protein
MNVVQSFGQGIGQARLMGTGTALFMPAPTGGINTRDPIQGLQPNEARELENLNPIGNAVQIRAGYAEHASSTGTGSVNTLHVHRGETADVLLAAGSGEIWNVTTTAATSIASGYSINDWQTEYYNGWSFFVNGADTPIRFDGTSTAATGFTGSGLSISNLVNIALVRNRLWFAHVNSADVWYGSIAAVTGTLTKFQLSQLSSGGYCMAIGSWSQDAGDGPDDYTVFVMSTGEVFVYSGDPGSTFALVGRFWAPPPVGRRCMFYYGGGTGVVTREGPVPLDAIVSGAAFDPARLNNFGKIAPSFSYDVSRYGGNAGWDVETVGRQIIINVPTSGTAARQYVYDIPTGAWTTWRGVPAASLVNYQDSLYFGGLADGIVWNQEGRNDNGSSIIFRSRGAFATPSGSRASNYTALRFQIQGTGTINGKFGFDIDYETAPLKGVNRDIASSTSGTTPWGSPWGSPWSASEELIVPWFATVGHGKAAAVALDASTDGEFTWYGTDVMARPGNYL